MPTSVKWTQYADDQRIAAFEAFGSSVNRKINQYGIVRKLGAGTTGKVFEAIELESGRHVGKYFAEGMHSV